MILICRKIKEKCVHMYYHVELLSVNDKIDVKIDYSNKHHQKMNVIAHYSYSLAFLQLKSAT